ncbi:9815_t:CDS:1, partial [Rhizophagus irregularis]
EEGTVVKSMETNHHPTGTKTQIRPLPLTCQLMRLGEIKPVPHRLSEPKLPALG